MLPIKIMKLIPGNLFKGDNPDRIITKVIFLIRVALVVCIFLSAVALAMTPFASGEPDKIGAFFFFATFYSFIWGTIPSIFLLTAITIDNSLRRKTRLQPIRTEVKLLITNIAIILIAVTIIKLL